MKKQAEGVSKEYDRLSDEYSKLQVRNYHNFSPHWQNAKIAIWLC